MKNYSQEYLQKKKNAKYSHLIDEIKIYANETAKLFAIIIGVGLFALIVIILTK